MPEHLQKLETPRPPDWDPMCEPTAEQLWQWYGDMPANEQLEMCARYNKAMRSASHCFQAGHEYLLVELENVRNALIKEIQRSSRYARLLMDLGHADALDERDEHPEEQAQGDQVDLADDHGAGGEGEADQGQEQQDDVDGVHEDSFVDTSAMHIADRVFPGLDEQQPDGQGN